MSQVGIIIAREYNERVKKKSFILTTLLVPLLMVVMMAVPSLLMLYAGGDTKEIAVIDESGVVLPGLKNNEELIFLPAEEATLEEALANRDRFGVLWVGADVLTSNRVQLYTNSSSSMMLEENLEGQIEDILSACKLQRQEIENLAEIMAYIETDITLQSFRNDEQEGSRQQSAGASFAISYVLGFVLYMFLLIYGQMVMQAVIEEKSSRVLDVLVTSARPFQLMWGKIAGIALVAITQIAIWGVLIFGLGAVGSSLLLPEIFSPEELTQMAQMQAGTLDASTVDPELLSDMELFSTFTDLGYLLTIFVYLVLYLVGGFLLYSALFAAVGASVDSMSDAGQLTTPITMPIIIALLMMFVVMRDPNSSVAFWFSIIPFTSPIVMMARIPAGIPAWEPILGLVLLALTTVAMVWMAAKIYRVGILMHGKKPTFKELWQWLRYK